MLDNPFALLFLVCGTPIVTHLFVFGLGWWFHGRGYRLTRGGVSSENSGVGYAPAVPEHLQGHRVPTAQHTPILDRLARQ